MTYDEFINELDERRGDAEALWGFATDTIIDSDNELPGDLYWGGYDLHNTVMSNLSDLWRASEDIDDLIDFLETVRDSDEYCLYEFNDNGVFTADPDNLYDYIEAEAEYIRDNGDYFDPEEDEEDEEDEDSYEGIELESIPEKPEPTDKELRSIRNLMDFIGM